MKRRVVPQLVGTMLGTVLLTAAARPPPTATPIERDHLDGMAPMARMDHNQSMAAAMTYMRQSQDIGSGTSLILQTRRAGPGNPS